MASLRELLDEVDALQSNAVYQERIPKAEREQAIGEMAEQTELGQWPGDAATIGKIQRAPTRAHIKRLEEQRQQTFQQVQKARTAESELKAQDRLTDPPVLDRAKSFANEALERAFPSPQTSVTDSLKNQPVRPSVPMTPESLGRVPIPAATKPIASAQVPPTKQNVPDFIPQDVPRPDKTNRTRLNPDDEDYFREWYADWAKDLGLDPDPDHPDHHYDYRGAFIAAEDPSQSVDEDTGEVQWHWPSRFKDPDHPRAIIHTPKGRLDTRTGTLVHDEPVPDRPPAEASAPPSRERAFQDFLGQQAVGGRTPESFGETNPLDRYQALPPKQPLSLGQAFAEAGKSVVRGGLNVAESTVKWIGIAAKELDDEFTTLRGTQEPKQLEEYATYRMGEKLKDLSTRLFPGRPDLQESFLLRQVPEALGSSMAFLAGGVAGQAAKLPTAVIPAVTGAMTQGAQQFEEAKQFKADDKTARTAFLLGSAIGTSEALPVSHLLHRLAPGTKTTITEALKQGSIQAIEEAVQEGGQQLASDVIAWLYDKDRKLGARVAESMGAGGVVGFLTGFLMAGTRRARTAPSGPQRERPEEPRPPDNGAVPPRQDTDTSSVAETEDDIINAPEIVVTPDTNQDEVQAQVEEALANVTPAQRAEIVGGVGAQAQETQETKTVPASVAPPSSDQAATPELPRVKPAVTPELLGPAQGEPAEVTSPSMAEHDKPKAVADMTFDEFLQASRFYRSGKTKNLQLPSGERIILRPESTESTWKEKSRDFLESVYRNTMAEEKAKQVTTRPAVTITETAITPTQAGLTGDVVGSTTYPSAPGVTPDTVTQAAQEAATSPINELPEPTPAQKEAGNYKKGHVSIAGLNISIENPEGSTRSGTDKDGNPWSVTMKSHYGYIRGTTGKDKDHLDVFVKPGTPEAFDGTVYIVDQNKPGTKTFDEHKIVLGATSLEEAKQLYRENYAKDWQGLGAISAVPMPEFQAWLKSGDTKKPFHRKDNTQRGVTPESLVPPSVSAPATESSTDVKRPSFRTLYDAGLEGKQSPIPVEQRTINETIAYESGLEGKMFPPNFRTVDQPSEVPELEPEAAPVVQASQSVASFVEQSLETSASPGTLAFDKNALFTRANEEFGGTKAGGTYTPKDAFDAVELGINRYLRKHASDFNPSTDTIEQAQQQVRRLREQVMNKIPSMGHYRTAEQDEFQQFSTPPDLAYVMNWAADLDGSDTVLEPSAGLGGLVTLAKNAGATVVTNELSQRRAELLKDLQLGPGFTENAEQLHNILPPSVKPTVVLMNPPFSSTAGRMAGERKSSNVLSHLEQALQRLQPGGRLVALIGKPKEGMKGQQTAVEKWIAALASRHAIRARIGLSGKGYAKYGTTFDNQILVVDKIPPTGTPIIAEVSDALDALSLLQPVRSTRQRPGSRPAESGRLSTPEQIGSTSGPGPVASAATRLVGPGSGTPIPGRTPDALAATGRRATGHRGRTTSSPAVSPGEPGRPGQPPPDRGAARQGPQSAVSQPTDSERAAPEADRGPDATRLPAQPSHSGITVEAADTGPQTSNTDELTESVYDRYQPARLKVKGAKAHPGPLVESAAMASTLPPVPTYQPNLPSEVLTEGKLSLAQLEAVVYAGQAHESLLPNGARRGFFIGDGTGVGKGREISGILLDNLRQGRNKALWISEKGNLVKSAVRDWADLGGNPSALFEVGKHKLDEAIARPEGIAFTTYTTLASGMESVKGGGLKAKEDKKTGKTKGTRLDQVIAWVGPDFDGPIIFDESHNMQNSVSVQGKRGDTEPAAMALAAVELQKRLPKARVVYVSATGATRVDAMVYAERLGLWGPGTPFAGKEQFIGKIQQGGLAAMEIVARDLKAMGSYLSRSLDYRDVTYAKLEHALTPEQREMYDVVAKAWQLVFQNMNAALELTGAKTNARSKSSARAKFWGSHQRFFHQILTALQMPSAIADMKRALADGHAVVVQLVNTNEAIQARQLQAREQSEEEDSLDDLDLTPRQNLMQYVQHAFPVQQYEEYRDEDGKKRSRPVVDSQGNPVLNARAIEMREELLREIGSVKVPDGPLEFILNTFGPDAVAEITGRTQRIVRQRDDLGREKVVKEKRSRAITAAEAKLFQDDKRQILVFSEAGGTGESYHADLRAKNQRKRIHYLVQAGWRADKAVQGLGRTHRTNEASAPQYKLVTTNLKGHRRFISTIARRLDQLGALTKGQRQTGSSGLIDAKDNLENDYSAGAVRSLIRDSLHGQVPAVPFQDLIESKMGLEGLIDENGALNDTRIPDVPQFLNRILALEIEEQNAVFDEFYRRLEMAVERDAANGLLDVGMETYRTDGATVSRERTVYTQPGSGAETKLVEIAAKHTVQFIPATEMEQHVQFKGYYVNRSSGRTWAMTKAGTVTTEQGAVIDRYKVFGPVDGQYQYVDAHDLQKKWDQQTNTEGRKAWDDFIAQHPPFRTEQLSLLTGTLLPIWDRLPTNNVRVVRVQTDDGRRHLGRLLKADEVPVILRRLGAESETPQLSGAEAMSAVLDDGATLVLANGWKLKRGRVANEARVELIGDNLLAARQELKDLISERIGFETRWFVPTGKPDVLSRLLQHRPIADVITKRQDGGTGRLGMALPQYGPNPRVQLARSDLYGADPLSTPALGGSRSDFGLTQSQHVFDNAASYEVRKGTNAKHARSIAKDALGAIDRAADTVSGAGGAFRTAGSGITVHGLGFTPELIKTGRIDLRGRIVRSLKDLARVAQVYRDPRFETFRTFYTKDNRIVGQEAFTSRMAAATSPWFQTTKRVNELGRIKSALGMGERVHEQVSDSQLARATYGMTRRMQRLGADGYYLVHNHPSGRPVPSEPDKEVTAEISQRVKGFKGHVIINSEEFGVIDTQQIDYTMALPSKQGDRLRTPSILHPLVGASVENSTELARVVKQLQRQDDVVTLLYLAPSSSGRGFSIRAIEDVPVNLVLRDKEFQDYLRGRERAYGTPGVVSAYSGTEPKYARAIETRGKALVRSGHLLDHAQWSSSVLAEDRTLGMIGMSRRAEREAMLPGRRVQMPVPSYASSDPEVEDRITSAQQGIGKGSIRARLHQALDEAWRKSTREFEHLPDTAEYAQLRTDLLQLKKQKAISVDRQLRHLHALVGDLIPEDYGLFERAILLRDLKREADAGRLLPFGYTPEVLARDLDRVNAEVSNNLLVEQRLDQRTAHIKDLSEQYREAMGSIGFDVSKKITKEDYFHHQVLEYAREQAASAPVRGTGKKIKTPTGSGFLKQRHGSTLDINTNYVQAELEVLGKMDYDVQLATLIRHVNEQHNMQPHLKEQARQVNERALQRRIALDGEKGPLAQEYGLIRQRIAIHMTRLKTALHMGPNETLTIAQIQQIADDPQAHGHESAKGVFKWINERRQFVKRVLGDDFKTWESLVPDTHRAWQPREGNIFYMADTIPHRLAQQLQTKMVEQLGISEEQVKAMLALGGKREQYVVPHDVADTLDNFQQPPSGVIASISQQILGHWKAGKLVGPHSVFKYNLRNLTGDAEATFVGNPKAFGKTWQAMRELWPLFTKSGPLEGHAKDWYERGGMGTLLQVNEMGDVNDLKMFKSLVERSQKGGVLGAVSGVFSKYWQTARLSTDFREAILRYANYLSYIEQIQANGKPSNYGASIPETVDALDDPRDKAFKLSNELLGAYDRISVTGQHLRTHWIPFWSWKEINFTRYKQLVKNALKEGTGVSQTARRGTAFLLKATFFWAMTMLWNHLFFPDEEKELNERTRNRIHLIIPPGRDEHGKILYLDGIGALGDLLAWVGLESAASHLAAGDLLHDRMTLPELAKLMLKAPANIVVQGLHPLLKLPAELAAGRSTFPDVFRPRAIQDPVQYSIDALTPFGPEFRAATGKPTVPYLGMESLEDLMVSRQDPGWAAYSSWQDIEDKWKARLDKPTFEGMRRSPKGQALALWRQAISLGDQAAIEKYKKEYFALGGDMKGLVASIKALAPLHGLTKPERAYVLGRLDHEERAILQRAEKFYQDEMMKILPPGTKAEVITSLLGHGGLSQSIAPSQALPPKKLPPSVTLP